MFKNLSFTFDMRLTQNVIQEYWCRLVGPWVSHVVGTVRTWWTVLMKASLYCYRLIQRVSQMVDLKSSSIIHSQMFFGGKFACVSPAGRR